MQRRLNLFLIPQTRLAPMIDWLIPLAFVLAVLPGGIYLAIVLLILLILSGRTVEALAALPLLVLGNPILFRLDGVEVVRYLPLLFGLAVLWPGLKITDTSVGWALAFVTALLVLNVVAVSALPSISLFKGILFIGVLWVLFNTPRVDWEAFARRVDRFIPFYLLASFATYFVPAIGFARNDRGFQGLTNQPQVFGVLVALLASWMVYRLWTRQSAISLPLGLLTVLALLGAILLSEARTALLGFVVAFLLTWLIQMLRSSRGIGLKIALTILIGGAGVVTITQSNILTEFLFKRTTSENVLEAADTSRGFLVRRSLENFQDHPVLGMGFGTPSFVDIADITYAPVIDVPIGVALEKGVWVTATLEEQGVVGLAVLALFFGTLMAFCIRKRSYMGIVILGFVLASNLGEMNMYSIGGFGILHWLLTITAARIKG
ncbi:O-antigen ligase family protein [Deinococcus marmoris]|uniref:O-antigen ligase family protein n=1 Tax=Deinococcus marmoris TaxID=249408 RepID=UPI000495B2EE|nr:O-antigen ligase family protein [Deinococcus marmoris]